MAESVENVLQNSDQILAAAIGPQQTTMQSIEVPDSHLIEPSNITAENSLEALACSPTMCSSEIDQDTQNHVSDIDEQTLAELGEHYLQPKELQENLNRALPSQPQPLMSTPISFSKVHGQNIELVDQSATWVPKHSSGWVHSTCALETGQSVTVKVSGSGCCHIGYVKYNPNSIGKCVPLNKLPFVKLNEIPMSCNSHEINFSLKEIDKKKKELQVISQHSKKTQKKLIIGDKVWPTCCVKFGIVFIEIFLNGTENKDRQILSDNHGVNIRLEDNNLRACSIKKNPASLCFLDSNFDMGQRIELNCVAVKKTERDFDLNVLVCFKNPETLKNKLNCLFDIICKLPLRTVKLLERDECNGNISLYLDHSMQLHYNTAGKKHKKQELPSCFKDSLWIAFELYCVKVTVVKEKLYMQSSSEIDQYTRNILIEKQTLVKLGTDQCTQNILIEKQTLVELGTCYLEHDKVMLNLNEDNVIQYITSAIEYMTLDLLEAKQITDGKSDATCTANYKAFQMLYTIAACAFYIRKTHSHIAGTLPNIAWKSFALCTRCFQYIPNFIPFARPATFMKLVSNALYSMLDSGELEIMRNTVESLESTSTFPTIHALMGFLNDEYNVQYIENGIKNYRDHGNLASDLGRARLLISFIEMGEALENASPRLQSLFDGDAVENLSIIRNAIVHPERPDNLDMVNDFLSGKSNSVTISGKTIDLETLAIYCIDQYDTVCNFLQLYKVAEPDEILQDIIDHVDDYAISTKLKIPRASKEIEFEKISKAYKEQICQIDKSDKGHKEVLDNEMIEWFKNKKFSDDIAKKLKDPSHSVEVTEKAIKTKKGEYDSSKAKSAGNRTKEDDALIKDYENVVVKHEKWQWYCTELSNITQEITAQKQRAKQCKISDRRRLAIKLIDSFLSYSTQVQTLFPLLNNFEYVCRTSTGDTSRGFPGHQDHPVLAFYQIMVGSLSRTLITIDIVDKIIPSELRVTLEETTIAARGYLAHIGVRKAGEKFSESIDRPAVFYTNSIKIEECIKPMRVMKYAFENGLDNFDKAFGFYDNLQVLLE